MPQIRKRQGPSLEQKEANDAVRPYLKERAVLQSRVNEGTATAQEKARLELLKKALKDSNSMIGQDARRLTSANRARQGRPQIPARR